MKNLGVDTVVLLFAMMMLTSTIVLRVSAPQIQVWNGYIKPAYPDYAPSGMPDFDQKQANWGPSPGMYTWCGPVAAANSLWWLDSEFESLVNPGTPVPPPTIDDHFGLVTSFMPGIWDDHDPGNVDPLVRLLANLMDTDGQRTGDGHVGTRVPDFIAGLNQYLIIYGVQKILEVHALAFPDFTWIDREVELCQDVELFLEFYYWTGSGWAPITDPSLENGHFVTCAGVDPQLSDALISDPFADTFEAGTAPKGGRSPVPHGYPHAPIMHNDAQMVSQDGYDVAQYAGPAPPYPPGQTVWELVNYLQAQGYPPGWHAFITTGIATSPVDIPQWEGYVKPSYPDYAPNGMPDFDQRQDVWGPAPGTPTWCGPVAVANSLWWLDSKYESLINPAPVPPPTISDNFSLVSSYNIQWDDHDPQNVDPLVRDLAWVMDTDGQFSGDGHIGTRWQDLESGIRQYLIDRALDTTFEVHDLEFPDFPWINNEVEICQDVELFLEFYQWTGTEWVNYTITNPSLENGHFVTCAGSNPQLSPGQVLISDPLQDAFEAGTAPGQAPPHAYPHGTWIHNDALYVSHDAYQVVQLPVGGPYAGGQQPVWELVGYLQTMGYDQTFHAFIRVAIATSPVEAVHDVAVTALYSPKTIVGKNYYCKINVTATNEGDYTETFNINLYANKTAGVYIWMGLLTVSSLPNGSSVTLTLTWNATLATGNYTLSAIADTVDGETETDDNTRFDGNLYIGVPCDVTGPTPGVPDGICDMRDIAYFCARFLTTPGSPNWDPNCDVTGQIARVPDDKVDMRDISDACSHFLETDP
jgi:hypothetical protein